MKSSILVTCPKPAGPSVYSMKWLPTALRPPDMRVVGAFDLQGVSPFTHQSPYFNIMAAGGRVNAGRVLLPLVHGPWQLLRTAFRQVALPFRSRSR